MSHSSIANRVVPSLGLACSLAACGGGGLAGDPVATTLNAVRTPVTLLDDDGRAMPSVVRPSDTGAWTQNARYATPEQARILGASLADDLIQIEVECCGEAGIDTAVGMVWALQASADLPSARAHVIVRCRDERLAAAAVNRLLQGGLREVWLVTADPE